ncbi:MAG: hypothetical protein WC464_00165 [Bdellovibrionales bacterium]|jgi:hypothetical protein
MKALDILQKTRAQLEDSHEFSKMYDDAISELEALQQHIKSLEAQLANTEQLTCKTCKWFKKDYCNNLDFPIDYSDLQSCRMHELKDTQ